MWLRLSSGTKRAPGMSPPFHRARISHARAAHFFDEICRRGRDSFHDGQGQILRIEHCPEEDDPRSRNLRLVDLFARLRVESRGARPGGLPRQAELHIDVREMTFDGSLA
jgi:hypothetical protein